ncbi:PTS mannose transporter subunit IIA [Lactobacillus kullabergensis]|uniref:PTS sugar transporter subunit IIA n=1 Tax=Lactobacillus kullabergensis TaxID=1218493 RepID=UPI0022461A9D|nr:PTS mannose transporter subunit IIA [Lactobacillus kullabergensis]MCX0292032.1 PTS mannose transporter subunit IIA [Lactobacillus kullabergensis]
MIKFVIATHGYFAKGLKMSTEFIMGKQKNLYAICAYTSECKDFPGTVQEILNNSQKDEIIFGTDIAGGSVNNELQKIVAPDDRLHLITGINLPFILEFLTSNESDLSKRINESITASRKSIINFDEFIDKPSTIEGDGFDSF